DPLDPRLHLQSPVPRDRASGNILFHSPIRVYPLGDLGRPTTLRSRSLPAPSSRYCQRTMHRPGAEFLPRHLVYPYRLPGLDCGRGPVQARGSAVLARAIYQSMTFWPGSGRRALSDPEPTVVAFDANPTDEIASPGNVL